MTWKAITEAAIQEEIRQGLDAMTPEQRRLWDSICITPKKWRLSPWGDAGGGFWAVAIAGKKVIWYNDIEDGFNCSPYSEAGVIDEYWCNQDELQWTVGRLLAEE